MNKHIKLNHLTSAILLATVTAQSVLPSFAYAKNVAELGDIEEALQTSMRYQLIESAKSSYYKSIHTTALPDIFDGFDYFYTEVKSRSPQRAASATWHSGRNQSEKPLYIGTPFVERDVIRLQLNQLLNRSYISSTNGDDDRTHQGLNGMVRQLYKNGVRWFEQNPTIKLGQPLTQSQINNLSQDMIWPEARTLSNGKKVVVPFVYLTKATIATKVDKTTLQVVNGHIETDHFLVDGGEVIADRELYIQAYNTFINRNGTVSSNGTTKIKTGELHNLSGTISGRDTQLIANRLVNKTLVYRHTYQHGFSELGANFATILGIDSLKIDTAGETIIQGGLLDSQGVLKINAGGSIQILPVEIRQQHEQSGKEWTDSSSSLVNIQSKLSAVDLLSLVSKEVLYAEGAVLESQGILELLSTMGVVLKPATDSWSYSKSFEIKTSGAFGSKEKSAESESRAEIVRTLLKAGKDLIISTEFGPITIQAVNLESEGITKLLSKDTINFEAYLERHNYSKEESYDDGLAFRNAGKGFAKEYAYYSEFVNKGGLVLEAAKGIKIDVVGDPNNFDNTLALLKQSPDMAWIQAAEDYIQSTPELQLEWNKIKELNESWDYNVKGLTPAGMAILSLAVAVATGGAGLTLFAGTGPLTAALNAGFTSLVTNASSQLIAGNSLSDTLKNMTSRDSIKGLATAMVTAGVMNYVDTSLMGGFESDVSSSLQNGGFVDSVVPDFIGNADEIASIADQTVNSILYTAVQVNVESLIDGHGLTSVKDLDKVLVNSLAHAAVANIGKNVAEQIGKAAKSANPISEATKYISHAALGCGLGAASAAINGANRNDIANQCGSGALGGVVGEFIADRHVRPRLEQEIAVTKGKVERFSEQTLSEFERSNGIIDEKTYVENKVRELQELKAHGVNITKLVAGITVYAASGNVETGANAAGNAAEHNALFLIPLLIKAVSLASAAYTAYQIIDSIKTLRRLLKGELNGDPKTILIDLAIDLGIDLAVGKLKIFKKIEDIPFEELCRAVSQKLKDNNMGTLAEAISGLPHHLNLDASGNPTKINGSYSNGSTLREIPLDRNGVPHVRPDGMDDKTWDEYRDYVATLNGGKSDTSPERFQFYQENDWEFIDGHWQGSSKAIALKNSDISKTALKVGQPTNQKINTADYPDIKGSPTVAQLAARRQEKLEIQRELIAIKESGKQLTPEQEILLSQTRREVNRSSEILGEMAAKHYANQAKLGKPLATGPGAGNGSGRFDFIYVDEKSGAVTILEAKGHTSSSPALGSRKLGEESYQQGHPKYIEAIILEMEKQANTTELRMNLRVLSDAVQQNKLSYKVVHQHITNSGALGSINIIDYKQG
ncbi:DUF637 domain-containing protein [Vibrio vulnificus]|nr:DUF637 domain-containing protein [Vibrio vulnificus]